MPVEAARRSPPPAAAAVRPPRARRRPRARALHRPVRRRARPEHERDLALRRLGEPLRELRRRPARDLLEPLRQLAADGHLPLRVGGRERAQRRGQPLRRLERDRRPRPAAQLLPQRRQPLLAAREKAEEAVLLRDEPRGDERRLDRRRPRQHRHVDAASSAARTSRAPGSDTPGRPASETSATRSPASSRGRSWAVRCASLCSWYERSLRLDPVPLEQEARVSRVLAEHDVGGARARPAREG